jgi:intracellular septation protein A
MRRALMLFAALWPLVYMIAFVVLILESALRGGGAPDHDLLVPFGVLVALHVATMLVMVAGLIAYVVHAWRNPRVKKDERTLWVLVLLLGGPIAMPIYWWIYVRGDSAKGRVPATAS